MSEQPTPLSNTQSEKLNQLAQEAAAIEGDSVGGFMKPGQEVKRRRGRPRKDEAGPKSTMGGSSGPASAGNVMGVTPDNTETYKQILSPVWDTLSHVAQQITGEAEAGMKPLEKELIVTSSAACVQQYMPDALGKHANLVLFLAATGTWSGRVYLLYLAKKELIEAQKRDRNPERKVNGADGHPSPVQ